MDDRKVSMPITKYNSLSDLLPGRNEIIPSFSCSMPQRRLYLEKARSVNGQYWVNYHSKREVNSSQRVTDAIRFATHNLSRNENGKRFFSTKDDGSLSEDWSFLDQIKHSKALQLVSMPYHSGCSLFSPKTKCRCFTNHTFSLFAYLKKGIVFSSFDDLDDKSISSDSLSTLFMYQREDSGQLSADFVNNEM